MVVVGDKQINELYTNEFRKHLKVCNQHSALKFHKHQNFKDVLGFI